MVYDGGAVWRHPPGRRRLKHARVEAIGVRAIVTVALWAVFTVSEAGAVAAQADADAGRAATRDKLEALLAAYAPARAMRFHRNAKQPFNIDGSINSGLTYASTFEIVITITEKQTIAFRVYPHYQGPYINLDKVRDPSGLMEKLLRLSDHGFFFWDRGRSDGCVRRVHHHARIRLPGGGSQGGDPKHPAARRVCGPDGTSDRLVGCHSSCGELPHRSLTL